MKREQQGSDGIFHVIRCDQDLACIFLFSNATNTPQDLQIMQLFQSLSLKNDRWYFFRDKEGYKLFSFFEYWHVCIDNEKYFFLIIKGNGLK